LGRIEDEQLVQDLVRVYGNAKGLFDYLNANPKLYEKWSRLSEGSEEKGLAANDLDVLEKHIKTNTDELGDLVTKVGNRIGTILEN
jgi:hypothetical protein